MQDVLDGCGNLGNYLRLDLHTPDVAAHEACVLVMPTTRSVFTSSPLAAPTTGSMQCSQKLMQRTSFSMTSRVSVPSSLNLCAR